MSRCLPHLGTALVLAILCAGCEDDPGPVPIQRYSERFESSFAVGDSIVLDVGNFAGSVNVRSGEAGTVEIVAVKWAEREEDLDQIEIEMIPTETGVRITTEDPSNVDHATVELEITAPPDTRPKLQSGAGTLLYEGLGQGDCRFGLGSGTITLELPADVNVEVYLAVGAGSIRVDFPVVGQHSGHVIDGVIGTGDDGSIDAQIGAGLIIVTQQ